MRQTISPKLATQQLVNSQRAELARSSNLRQTRMAQIDAARASVKVYNEEDTRKQKFDEAILANAEYKLLEEVDDAKTMTKMSQYAKTVAVRDRQLEEKRWIQAQQADEEKRIELDMEVERVKLIKQVDQREQYARSQQLVAAKQIVSQMSERQEQRTRQKEVIEEEGRMLVAQMKEHERRDEEFRQQKIATNRKRFEETNVSNAAAARAKFLMKQEEVEEDKRIAEYLRVKAVEELKREEELERIQQLRNIEIARLQAMHQRDSDQQAALDGLRAKRHKEAKDREWRQQQLEIARKEETRRREINESRQRMREDKTRRFADQALQEQDEYYRVLEWNREQIARDQAKEEAAKERDSTQKEFLRAQISERAMERKAAHETYLAEGLEFERRRQLEKAKLNRLKQAKLEELKVLGVPDKYLAELANKKIMVDTIHYPNEKDLAKAAANSKAFAAKSRE